MHFFPYVILNDCVIEKIKAQDTAQKKKNNVKKNSPYVKDKKKKKHEGRNKLPNNAHDVVVVHAVYVDVFTWVRTDFGVSTLCFLVFGVPPPNPDIGLFTILVML